MPGFVRPLFAQCRLKILSAIEDSVDGYLAVCNIEGDCNSLLITHRAQTRTNLLSHGASQRKSRETLALAHNIFCVPSGNLWRGRRGNIEIKRYKLSLCLGCVDNAIDHPARSVDLRAAASEARILSAETALDGSALIAS